MLNLRSSVHQNILESIYCKLIVTLILLLNVLSFEEQVYQALVYRLLLLDVQHEECDLKVLSFLILHYPICEEIFIHAHLDLLSS
jgi:hypothetical protein